MEAAAAGHQAARADRGRRPRGDAPDREGLCRGAGSAGAGGDAKRPLHDATGTVRAWHLNIRRRDGKPIFRDWRHFQWIKNELVGEECEGLELYPAESRLNDTSNKYHLFVFADPTYRIPFGMQDRDVIERDDAKKPGHRQRRM
jgi:hypothetical protein